MIETRILTNHELDYIKSRIRKGRVFLFWTFLILFIFVLSFGLALYFEKHNNIIINGAVGILLVLVGSLHWFYKGYKNYQINPIVYNDEGIYKRIYESYGKNGAYYDTINGVKVKIPWHWRTYLKNQKTPVTYEYIVQKGAVAMNTQALVRVISINNEISLEYELQHGLQKAKSYFFLEIVAVFCSFFALLFLSFNVDFDMPISLSDVLHVSEETPIVMTNAESVSQLTKPTHVKVNNGWVFRFKRPTDFSGEYLLISKKERDRIYNHPSSNMYYRFLMPSQYVIKPDKETFIKNLDNSYIENTIYSEELDSITRNRAIQIAFDQLSKDYEKRKLKALRMEKVLAELKPSSFIARLNKKIIDEVGDESYNIKSSLEKPQTVMGYYLPKQEEFLDADRWKVLKNSVINNSITLLVCAVVLLYTFWILFKIGYNSYIKKKLVKQQLSKINANMLER